MSADSSIENKNLSHESPVEDLTLRASFGTGFVPPSLANIKATVRELPTSPI